MPEPPPAPPRFGLRQAAFTITVMAWVLAVLLTERAPPPTPPLVPYAVAAR